MLQQPNYCWEILIIKMFTKNIRKFVSQLRVEKSTLEWMRWVNPKSNLLFL